MCSEYGNNKFGIFEEWHFYLDLKDLSGDIGYIEYQKISFNQCEISANIEQRYAVINYVFE